MKKIFLINLLIFSALLLLLVGGAIVSRLFRVTDMADQPSIKPQEQPLEPPPGSVPVQGRERRMDRMEAAQRLTNPRQPTPASVENGGRLFQIYCALCHGPEGKGNGPIAAKFVPPPDITLEFFRQRTDGFLYGTIRDGGAIMPSQGEGLSQEERWDIVNYLRSLQRR